MRWLPFSRYFRVSHTAVPLVRGASALALALMLGAPIPLLLVVDGDYLELPDAYFSYIFHSWRYLNLTEKVLLSKPAQPEIIVDLRGSNPAKIAAALRSVERIDLRGRSLRRAQLRSTLIPMADLRNADLRYASLERARLYGADLQGAKLQGARLDRVQLQGGNLESALLHGASLGAAQLQATNLQRAELQATNLFQVNLQSADLWNAKLQGADLTKAQLQGANLDSVKLHGATLRQAVLYSKFAKYVFINVVDVSGVKWQPLTTEEVRLLNEQSGWARWSNENRPQVTDLIREGLTPGATPLKVGTCLQDKNTEVQCEKAITREEFRQLQLTELEKIACESPESLWGVLEWHPEYQDSIRLALQKRLEKGVSKTSCPGLVPFDKESFKYHISFEPF